MSKVERGRDLVTLARVRSLDRARGRLRLSLRAAPVAPIDGALDTRTLSFLSPESLEWLPLSATSAVQTHDALLIEAELGGDPERLQLESALVVLRGAPCIEAADPSPAAATAGIDYLARDFDAFRTLMLDRITSLTPSWTDRSAADLGVMLSEVLAYLADGLTYNQDAVATEAYLGTARRRLSVRRHARLLGYWLDQGLGARVWVQLRARQQVSVPRGTRLLAGLLGHHVLELGTLAYQEQRARASAVFETMEHLEVRPELNAMRIWDGDQRHFVIEAGATAVEIRDAVFFGGEEHPITTLRAGEVLLLAPSTPDDWPPHPVRVTRVERLRRGGVPLIRVEWARADAPRHDLAVTRTTDGITQRDLTLLSGNLVLADFGETCRHPLPTRTTLNEAYEPLVPYPIVSLAAPHPSVATPAAACTEISTDQVCPAIVLKRHVDLDLLAGKAPRSERRREPPAGTWKPVPDLLLASPYSEVFVAEASEDGWSLRFGDGIHGRRPPLGSFFEATFRVGDTTASNVGMGALTGIVGSRGQWEDWTLAGVTVSNPLPAVGGRGGESLPHAKQAAPAWLQQVNAAVTLDDYATIARRVEGVVDAIALLRFTGSWLTTFVHVRLAEDVALPRVVHRRVEQELERARLAGRSIQVREPIWVPLSLSLRVWLRSGFNLEQTRAAVRAALAGQTRHDGEPGFFHPARWSFGQTIFSSAITTWIRGVPGVAAVLVLELQREHAPSPDAAPSSIALGRAELPQLLDAPFRPETGTLRLEFVEAREERA
jgi:hypothetical protein